MKTHILRNEMPQQNCGKTPVQKREGCCRSSVLHGCTAKLCLLEAWGMAAGWQHLRLGPRAKAGENEVNRTMHRVYRSDHYRFFAELALHCIISHESSWHGDANLQRLQSLLKDDNLPLHTCQSLSGCFTLCTLKPNCHILLPTKQHSVRKGDFLTW